MTDTITKDMQTIKDCAYVVKDALDDHMTSVAQRNILYIVRIADKYISEIVTPKTVDCRVCMRYKIINDVERGCIVLKRICTMSPNGENKYCTNGSEFKPSAPITLYNVTGE